MSDSVKLFILQCVMLCIVLFAGWCNSRRKFIVDLKKDDRIVVFIEGVLIFGMIVSIMFTVISGGMIVYG